MITLYFSLSVTYIHVCKISAQVNLVSKIECEVLLIRDQVLHSLAHKKRPGNICRLSFISVGLLWGTMDQSQEIWVLFSTMLLGEVNPSGPTSSCI